MTESDGESEAVYMAVVLGHVPPDEHCYADGRAAHLAGEPFHSGPRPFFTIRALSWRMGWNDAALKQRAPDA